MEHWTVYCHTHVESGRRYVGLTKQTMMKRWKTHVQHAKYSKDGRWHFPNAIRKYGKEAFIHEVLEICDTLESGNAAEEKWIVHFDTRNPDNGFNIAKGGNHVPHKIRKNPWDNLEYRNKQLSKLRVIGQTSEARANSKAALNTPESKTKRSISSKIALSRPGVINKRVSSYMTTVNTPESKAKRSAASKAALNTPESKAKRSIASKMASNTPESRAKRSAASKALWNDPEFKSKNAPRLKIIGHTPQARMAAKMASNTPESRAKRSAASKALWNDPEFKSKMVLILKNRTKENYPAVRDFHNRRSKVADERSILMTHILCDVHRYVSINECYCQIANGRAYYSCKQCKRSRARELRSLRRV